jgi:hypothetical protein
MSVIQENIVVEQNGTISFGNYSVDTKQKVDDYKVGGDLYTLRTHKSVTRLEKNSKLLIETVPGATVHNMNVSDSLTRFDIEGFDDTQITLELESGKEYTIFVDDVNLGKIKSNISGKINFSVELGAQAKAVKIEKN